MARRGSSGAAYGHVCFSFDDDATLVSAGREFLAEGRADGRELWWVGDSTPPPGLVSRVVPVSSAYATGAVVDPEAQVEAYAAATEAALAAGYTGLRVVAEATPLVRTAEQLAAFCRYEHLIDTFVTTHPFSAMCAYDRRVLGDRAIDELACLHSRTNTGVQFRLHGCVPQEGSAALTGELDLTTDELLDSALGHTAWPDGAEVVLRAEGLRFVDHGSLVRMDRWAARRDLRLVLRGARGATRRLADLLELRHLRVELAA